MRAILIIPARYGSTRLPGKPLTRIAGRTMLSRVCDIARAAARDKGDIGVVVATDDARIGAHCEEIGAPWVMTPTSCPSGTDRALAALRQLPQAYDVVINLQGDAPLTPPDFIIAMLQAFEADPAIEAVTPAVRLSWPELDRLRAQKRETPFSGTCVIVDPHGNARWFSKQIIPAMRNEERCGGKGPYPRYSDTSGCMATAARCWKPTSRCRRDTTSNLRDWNSFGFWSTATASASCRLITKAAPPCPVWTAPRT